MYFYINVLSFLLGKKSLIKSHFEQKLHLFCESKYANSPICKENKSQKNKKESRVKNKNISRALLLVG